MHTTMDEFLRYLLLLASDDERAQLETHVRECVRCDAVLKGIKQGFQEAIKQGFQDHLEESDAEDARDGMTVVD